MPFNYGKMQGTATKLLRQFKQGSIFLVREIPSSLPGATRFDPGEPSIVLTPLPGSVAKGVASNLVRDGLALAGDTEVTSEVVAGAAPIPGRDKLRIDGVDYGIIQWKPVPEAGTAVAWKFLARK